ncbi:LOW QUALITY PROTEIN: hypothetical protein SORBI_3005G017801 [Sorghum bicolor]|uniref:GST N-terminal domain-containing protein n=1 Tax=Sorghum bicolor TaxID=4558 RepID=A0A1Z5RGN5_SORBI|nr:LOW QUALITY PROTEIN: hypothetical protein SORBI_3005G017801 [Sorghum bicolor]
MDHHLEQQAAESEKKAAVKLLGFWASPYVLQVKWALAMKGVEYEYTEEDLRSKSAELLAYNPVHKKVPVLVYHGRPIAESQVILEFIDEAWNHRGDPILPRDPYQRAMARFRARFQQEKEEDLGGLLEAGELKSASLRGLLLAAAVVLLRIFHRTVLRVRSPETQRAAAGSQAARDSAVAPSAPTRRSRRSTPWPSRALRNRWGSGGEGKLSTGRRGQMRCQRWERTRVRAAARWEDEVEGGRTRRQGEEEHPIR